MKILLLADEADPRLWEHLDRKRLDGVELILACGDLPAEYLSFLTCFTDAPIVYVPGNHDAKYVEKPPEGCICADGRVVVCRGIRILGLGGSMRYKKGPYQYTEREMGSRILGMYWRILWHGGFDILMTHAPALGQGDDTDLAHRGFACFLKLMERFKPDLMVHGHVHQNYRYDFRRTRTYRETQIINGYGAYLLEYEPKQRKKGFRFALKRRKAE